MIKPIIPKDLAGVIFKLPDDQIFLDKINELCDVVNEQQRQKDKKYPKEEIKEEARPMCIDKED